MITCCSIHLITAAATYYIGISALSNTTYDSNVANSGTEGMVGEYRFSRHISETQPDLSMFYDYCWIDNVVVSTSPTGTISDVSLSPDDTLYVNYKFTNSGYATASAG